MSSNLKVQVALSHRYSSAATYREEPLYALLDISPATSEVSETHSPLNLVIVVDSSGTMHNFQLSDEEREYWLGVAISRDEIEQGEADALSAVYWTGQTLAEMQTSTKTSMSLAVDGIKNILARIRPTDKVAVIAFADHVHTVFTERDWQILPEQCLSQLDALREQQMPVDIGTGTYMADALRTAGDFVRQNTTPGSVNRLIILSDGIVQDQDATIQQIGSIQSGGLSMTTIGVGAEFDEEFLTRIADNSRGEYYYAASEEEITACLDREMTTLQTTGVTNLYLAVRGQEGAVVQDMVTVKPSMAMFEEIYTEEGWLRAKIGDISSTAPTGLLVQIAPPLLDEGVHVIAEVVLTSTGTDGTDTAVNQTIYIDSEYTNDVSLVNQVDEDVMNLVSLFEVYRMERDAQRAQERGDIDGARAKLGAATRQLQRMGQDELAHDMEQQITSLGTGATDPSRVKRIKATTRRLANTIGGSTTSQ